MIRKLEKTDVDKVANLWLEANLTAHDFISEKYWKDHFNMPYVLAKADGTLKGEILKRVGADEIVYPEEEMGARIANNLLGGSMTDLFDLSADTSIVKVPARKEWINKSLVDINFRGKYNVNVIAIEGEGGVDGAPDPTKPIKDEENLVLIGKKEDLVKLRK